MAMKEMQEAKLRKTRLDLGQAQELAESWLRQSSVRITAARTRVLAILLSADRAYSHHEVQEVLSDMDRVTLYRALDCLTEAGLAHKIAGDDRVNRYSAGADLVEDAGTSLPVVHQHSHFKCTRCAKVFCLPDHPQNKPPEQSGPLVSADSTGLRNQVQAVLQQSLGAGFQSHDIEFTIKGWCADCAH